MPGYLNCRILPVFVFVLLTVSPVYAERSEQGESNAFEEAVEQDSNGKGKLKTIEKAVRNRSDDDDDDGESVAGVVIESLLETGAMGDAFYGLGGLLFGAWPKHSRYYNPNFWNVRYALYPYSTRGSGLFSSKSGYGAIINATGHYIFNNSYLRGYSVRSRFSPSPLMDIEFHITGMTESLDAGDDHLAFYDVYLNYHRVRHHEVAVWWGLGLKGMHGDDSYQGPAMNIGMEIYPGRPLSLHAAVNVGRINTHAMWETLFRLNFHLNRSMFYIGYQRFSVNTVALGGIIGGFGLYF